MSEDESVRLVVRAGTTQVDGDWAFNVSVELSSLDGERHEVLLDVSRGTTGTMTREGFQDDVCHPGAMAGHFDESGFRHPISVPSTGPVVFNYEVRSEGMRCPGGLLTTTIVPQRGAGAAVSSLGAVDVDLNLTRNAPDLVLHPSSHTNPGCTPDIDDCCG